VFGIGGVELVVAGVVVAAGILAWRFLAAPWTRVDTSTAVGVDAPALEVPLARLLSDLPDARLVAAGPTTWTLAVSRTQLWTLVPAVLLFPFGLLFLLFREHASLVVGLRPRASGAEVHVIGTTRQSVRDAVEQALAELPSAGPPGRTPPSDPAEAS
jgi:predicted metal-binding membrane protein